MPVAFKPVFTTVSRALLAALHRARSRMSLPSAGTCQSPAAPASSAALGFLVLLISCTKRRGGICALPQVSSPSSPTEVTTEMLLLLSWDKLVTKPFASLDKLFYC